MNNKFLALTAVATVLSLATYFGLDYFFPYQKEEIKVAETIPVDEVFSGGLQPPAATEDAGSSAAEPAAAPAAEPAPTPASVAAASSKPAATAETAAAPASAAPADRMAMAAEPTAEPEPAPVPQAAAKTNKTAAETAGAEPAAPPPKTASKPAGAPKKSAATPSTPVKQHAPVAELTQWWGKEDPDTLSLTYAASAAYKKAIVLMFNGAFDTPDSANKNVQVLDSKGNPVAGSWQVASNNKRMLVFAVDKTARYKVVLKPGLTDRSGRTLAQELQGPVYVQ